MSLNSWRGGGLSCCFRHPALKPLKSPNQRWRSGWVARGSLGTGILVPGIVQNERTFNPHPLFPSISLYCHQTPSPPPLILCRTPKQTSPCHPPLRMAHSEVAHLPIKPLTPCQQVLQYCPRYNWVLGFSCGDAHVFTWWDLLSLWFIHTLPGALSCDTVAFVLQDPTS